MKKAYFNDEFGQTAFVINGTKTQFRQIVPQKALAEWEDIDDGDEYSRSVYYDEYDTKMRNFLLKYAQYKVGEVVPIAQSYFDIKTSANSYRPPIWGGYKDWHEYVNTLPDWDCAGQYNKMFVKADLMPHRIRIERVRVERLQDISDADCLAEGIEGDCAGYEYSCGKNRYVAFKTPKIAYSSLIDKISGKGTWESNPFVFVYNFKLVK